MSSSAASRLALLASHVSPANLDCSVSPSLNANPTASAPIDTLTRDTVRSIGSGTVTLDVNYRPGIALIKLSQPAKRNAMSGKMTAELADAVDRLEAICVRGGWKGNRRGAEGRIKAPRMSSIDGAGASKDKEAQDRLIGGGLKDKEAEDKLIGFIIAGHDNTFCAGFDLTGVPASASATRAPIVDLMIETLHRMRSLPLISLAAQDGFTLGGGTEIAMHTDHRIMATGSKMRCVQIKMGLASAWEGGSKLFRLLPRGRSAFLQIYGQSPILDPALALSFNLIDAIAPAGQTALEFGTAFMTKYVQGEDGNPHSVMAIRGLKELADTFDDRFVEEDERAEAEVRTILSATDLSRKALAGAAKGSKVTKRV